MLSEQIQCMTSRDFEVLYLNYYPSLLAYAKCFVDTEDAEEVVQDMMVWLWENRKNIVLTSSLKNYMFRSIRNNCLTQITQGQIRQHVHTKIYEQIRSYYENPDFYDIDELVALIEKAVNDLPENYKVPFVKNRFEGMTYAKIAEDLNISPKTVDYRIGQALKLLRISLKDFIPMYLWLFFQLK